MENFYQDNINIIDDNWNKLSQLHNDLLEFDKLSDSKTENKGNVAQYINPNLPNKNIRVNNTKYTNEDYRESINKILLDLYNQLSYHTILTDIQILSKEIKDNYKLNSKITINRILIKEYNRLINGLKIFDDNSIDLIYDTISNQIQKFDTFKIIGEVEFIFFTFVIKDILINLNTTNEVQSIMKEYYPKSKDTNTSITRFYSKIDELLKCTLLDDLTIYNLNHLSKRLKISNNTTIHNRKLSSSHEMNRLLKLNNIEVTQKKSQLLYNEVLRKIKIDKEYKINFVLFEQLTD